MGMGFITSLVDNWISDMPLYVRYPRLFALERIKDVSVAVKCGDVSLDGSFRRQVRDGYERQQWLIDVKFRVNLPSLRHWIEGFAILNGLIARPTRAFFLLVIYEMSLSLALFLGSIG
ncbi:hypothetical protein Tco_0648280 [Tanacetum coccineum]